MEILIGLVFLLGCLFLGLFLATGSVMGYGAQKNANRALRKADRLQQKLDDILRKVTRLERGLQNLQGDLPDTESTGETLKGQVDLESELLTSEKAIDEQPEELDLSNPPHEFRGVAISSAIPKQSRPEGIESGTEHTPDYAAAEIMDDVASNDATVTTESEDPLARLTKGDPNWTERFRGMNWETFVGTYLLRIVGVGFITVAVFIVLALVAQKTGPGFRVFLGYCVSAALLIGGRITEKRQTSYARVVYGGGLAIAYFVTFATHYIPMSRIFESALPSLGGMAIIVGIWAIVAQKRRSPVIALLVTALGHFTIALTTFTVPNPSIYSAFGIVLLSLGSAFFLLRNRWYYIAAMGMLASYGNHLALMARSTSSDTVTEFVVGMSVLTAYLLIFSFAELLSCEKLRRETIPNWFRSVFVALNTSCYFALGSLLVEGYTFTQEYHHVFRYGLAMIMLLMAVLYYVRRKHDPLYNTFTTKATALVTFGLAFQFSGNTLTTWLAIEMVVLLISSRRSGLVVTRILAHAVGLVTLGHGLFSFLTLLGNLPYDDPAYVRTLIRSVIPVMAFGVFSQIYERTDWSTRMRLGLKVPKELHELFWQLDLVPEPWPDSRIENKPLNGLLFPYGYAAGGAILFLCYSLRLFDVDDRFNLYALISFGLLVAGWVRNARPYAAMSLLYIVFATIITFHTMIDVTFSAFNAFGVVALILCALATEKRLVSSRDALVFHRKWLSPYVLYASALWSVSLYLNHFFDSQQYIISLLVLSLICGGLTRRLHGDAFALGGTVILFCAHVIWHVDYLDLGEYLANADHDPSIARVIAALIIVACVAGDRFGEKWNLNRYSPVLIFIVFATGLHFIHDESADPWFGLGTAAMAFGFLGYALLFKSKEAGAFALLSTIIASVAHTAWAYDATGNFLFVPTTFGFVALTGLWIAFERLNSSYSSSRSEAARSIFTVVCIAATTIFALILLERIPALADLYLTVSWALLAVTFFAMALVSMQKRYRYAGLTILALAAFRVIVYDTSTLDAINRVLAFGGLGAILLGLGFGYSKAFGEDRKSMPEEDKT